MTDFFQLMFRCEWCGMAIAGYNIYEEHRRNCWKNPHRSPTVTQYPYLPIDMLEQDNINPDHYKEGGIEVIDILKAKLTPEEFRGFLKGNVIKYTFRARLKNGEEDYKKANWYSTFLSGVDPRVKPEPPSTPG